MFCSCDTHSHTADVESMGVDTISRPIKHVFMFGGWLLMAAWLNYVIAAVAVISGTDVW